MVLLVERESLKLLKKGREVVHFLNIYILVPPKLLLNYINN